MLLNGLRHLERCTTSVIVPGRNRDGHISRCANSVVGSLHLGRSRRLAAQDLEFLVGTLAVARSIVERAMNFLN